MNFKDLLLRAKDGDQQAKEEIFLMYRPLLFKESCVNGIFDEDLFQAARKFAAQLLHYNYRQIFSGYALSFTTALYFAFHRSTPSSLYS